MRLALQPWLPVNVLSAAAALLLSLPLFVAAFRVFVRTPRPPTLPAPRHTAAAAAAATGGGRPSLRWARDAAAWARSPRGRALRRTLWWGVLCCASFAMFAVGELLMRRTTSLLHDKPVAEGAVVGRAVLRFVRRVGRG